MGVFFCMAKKKKLIPILVIIFFVVVSSFFPYNLFFSSILYKDIEYNFVYCPLKYDSNGISFLYKFADNPYFSINDDTKQSVINLSGIADAQDYVIAFSDIERDILSQYCYIPVFYKNTYLVMKSENTDILYEPFSQSVNFQDAKNFD